MEEWLRVPLRAVMVEKHILVETPFAGPAGLVEKHIQVEKQVLVEKQTLVEKHRALILLVEKQTLLVEKHILLMEKARARARARALVLVIGGLSG